MDEEKKDVKQEETTSSESSTETNTTESQTEGLEQTTDQSSGEDVNAEGQEEAEENKENKIPYTRVKEMLAKEREKIKKEILANLPQETEQQKRVNLDDENIKTAKSFIEDLVEQKLKPLKIQTELDRTLSDYPDFPQYKEQVLAKLKEVPSLSFTDAYKIVKFEDGQNEATEKGKKAAYKKQQEKKNRNVETSGVRKVAKTELTSEDIMNPKIPLSKLREMLPHD